MRKKFLPGKRHKRSRNLWVSEPTLDFFLLWRYKKSIINPLECEFKILVQGWTCLRPGPPFSNLKVWTQSSVFGHRALSLTLCPFFMNTRQYLSSRLDLPSIRTTFFRTSRSRHRARCLDTELCVWTQSSVSFLWIPGNVCQCVCVCFHLFAP